MTINPFASVSEIAQNQLSKLNEQLSYLKEKSLYYRELFASLGISEFKEISDLSKIPTVDKTILQEQGKAFWANGEKSIVDYVNTTGTISHALTVPLTDSDLDRLAYNEYLSFLMAGCTSEDVFQLTTTVDKRFMAGLAYVMGARKLGAGMVRMGPGSISLQWETIDELQTTVLIVVPSFLLKMIQFAKANGIDINATSVKKAICIGEPIRQDDLTPNALAREIQSNWDIELYSTYASTEMATAFTECEAGQGGHLQPDLIIAQVLDEDGNEVPDGQLGELTITTLGVEGFPLLRFQTGDICVKYSEPCSCGRNTPRIGPVLGRKNHLIKTKGTSCYPQVIFNVLDIIDNISLYQVELVSNDYHNDEVIIHYALKEEITEADLITLLKAKIRFTPKLKMWTFNELFGRVHPPTKRKPIKLIDSRI